MMDSTGVMMISGVFLVYSAVVVPMQVCVFVQIYEELAFRQWF